MDQKYGSQKDDSDGDECYRAADSLPSFTPHPGVFNMEEARNAAYNMLVAIGEDPTREGLRMTPDRVARANKEMFSSLQVGKQIHRQAHIDHVNTSDFDELSDDLNDSTVEEFQDEEAGHILSAQFLVQAHGLICVRNIEFFSTCEHHLLPFYGNVDICYELADKASRFSYAVGLSKLARLVQFYAHKPQVQERLTDEITSAIMKNMDAQGVLVRVKAHHMCMSMRGIHATNAFTVTLSGEGSLKYGHGDKYVVAQNLLNVQA